MLLRAPSVASRLLIVVAAAVIPQALLAAVLMHRYVASQRAAYQEQVSDIARGLAAGVDREMLAQLRAAITLSHSEALLRGDEPAFRAQARAAMERGDGWRMLLIDSDGAEAVDTAARAGATLPRAPPELWQPPLRSLLPQITPLLRLAPDQPWMAGATVPTTVGTAHRVIAVLATVDSAAAPIAQQRLPAGAVLVVIDRNGVLVTRRSEDGRARRDAPAAAEPATAVRADDGPATGAPVTRDMLPLPGDPAEGRTVTRRLDGMGMLTAYARAPLSGWVIELRVPEDAVVAPLSHSLWLIGGCGGLLSLLAFLLAAYHARGIARSVDALADAAAALDAGIVPRQTVLPILSAQAAADRIRAAAQRLAAQAAERAALLAQLEDHVAARTRELRDSEARFRVLAETATDMIVRIDRAGTFRYVSPAAEALTLQRPEALLGRRLRDLALVSDLPQVRAFEHALLHDHAVVRCTFRLRPRDGVVVWVEAAGHRISDDSEIPNGSVVALRDVSERKAAEEQVARAAGAARAADRAKSEFLARMSHELRTPLNAVSGFAEVLVQDPTLKPVHRDWASYIVSGARQLLRLVEDVLDLARIESGRLKIVIGTVAVAPLIEEAAHLLAPSAEERRVRLLVDPVPADLTVHADRARLLQVLLNLGSNAIKYNHLGGQVRLAVSVRTKAKAAAGHTSGDAEARAADSAVRFTVADDGPGIPAARLSEIFQPFNRAGEEGGAVEGSGIGLAIARQLVGLMRGTIAVDSDAGRGATFHVDLPAGERGAGAAASRSGPAHDRSAAPFTVLYIEDAENAVQLMHAIFTFVPGARLITATGGVEGLRKARTEPIDCVITDIRLPDLDGFAVLAALRADPLTIDLPVIAVSGEAMPDSVAQGRSAGFAAYITKPFRLTELIEALEAVRRQVAAPPARLADADV